MENIIKLETIQDYNNLLGTKTLHPLVSVTDLSTLKSIRHCRKNFGFYCVFYKELACGTLQYGRNKYDYEDGTLVFISPGQIAGINDDGETVNPKGIVLMFHADLLYGTPLARRMKDYTFFSYESNEALHMSDRERRIILNCFHEIREELEHTIDKHTKQIITSNIETLLNHCVRFYERQFVTREDLNLDAPVSNDCWTITSRRASPRGRDCRRCAISPTRYAFRPTISAIWSKRRPENRRRSISS